MNSAIYIPEFTCAATDIPEFTCAATDIPEATCAATDIPEATCAATERIVVMDALISIPENMAVVADIPKIMGETAYSPDIRSEATDSPETKEYITNHPEIISGAIDIPIMINQTTGILDIPENINESELPETDIVLISETNKTVFTKVIGDTEIARKIELSDSLGCLRIKMTTPESITEERGGSVDESSVQITEQHKKLDEIAEMLCSEDRIFNETGDATFEINGTSNSKSEINNKLKVLIEDIRAMNTNLSRKSTILSLQLKDVKMQISYFQSVRSISRLAVPAQFLSGQLRKPNGNIDSCSPESLYRDSESVLEELNKYKNKFIDDFEKWEFFRMKVRHCSELFLREINLCDDEDSLNALICKRETEMHHIVTEVEDLREKREMASLYDTELWNSVDRCMKLSGYFIGNRDKPTYFV